MEPCERFTGLIYEAIDEMNRMAGPGEELKKDADTVLLGPNGSLDSLRVVNLIVAIEERIEPDRGTTVSVFDLFWQRDGDWTVADLAASLAEEAVVVTGADGP